MEYLYLTLFIFYVSAFSVCKCSFYFYFVSFDFHGELFYFGCLLVVSVSMSHILLYETFYTITLLLEQEPKL